MNSSSIAIQPKPLTSIPVAIIYAVTLTVNQGDIGKSMQIEHFWDGVREYPAHLLPLFTKLRL